MKKANSIFFFLFCASCTKKEDNYKAPQTNNIAALRTTAISFNEPDPLTASSDLANALGFSTLVIKSGDYQVSFDDNTFGRIQFDIDRDSSELIPEKATTISTSAAGGIRIARIHQRNRTCNCCGGIGFRCGIVSFFDEPESAFVLNNTDDRTVYSTYSYDSGDPYHIYLDFSGEVDWDAMNN